jgi:hypothetical protein
MDVHLQLMRAEAVPRLLESEERVLGRDLGAATVSD